MRGAKLAIAAAAAAIVSGCVTAGTETVRFQAGADQQAIMRDGESVITSRKKNSVVTIRPATRQAGSRPGFIVGIDNISRKPFDFRVSEVSAVQLVDGETTQSLKVYNYDELVQEEQNAQVARGLAVAMLSGANSGLAGRNYYAQSVANDQNTQLAVNVAASGQQNLAALEQLSIKDQTVMPGESYAGKLYMSAPEIEGQKSYLISFRLGPDQHNFRVVQGGK